jgi:mannitol operon repressor
MSSKKRKQDREQMALKSQDLQGFIDEFQKESDRATAILGAALLDEKLLQLLTAFLINDKKEVDLLLDVEQPVGSFGARIRMVYCLGLLTRRAFDILIVIKRIRNAFAHQLHGLSFADPEIVRECDKLRSILKDPPDLVRSGRTAYLSATLSAQLELWAMTTSIEASQRRCKVPEWKTLVAWRR